jgi:ribosomal protein S18 acetylase RimI-like enzyme
MSIAIIETRPDHTDAIILIDELEAVLSPLYPSESRHGYSVDKLLREGVAFFVTYRDGAPAGCGGVQVFGTDYAEVKRMYVRPEHRGVGLAKRLLAHLAEYTRHNGITILRLETGIHQTEAIRLYESAGFERVAPFGNYQEDPLSVFFEKRLI